MTIAPDATSPTGDEFDAALQAFLTRHGRTLADVNAGNGAPTVAEHTAGFLATLTANTRRTYATHLLRLRDGIGPICDQLCEICLDPTSGYRCRCGCSRCTSSRLTVTSQADLTVGPATYSLDNAKNLAAIARRVAVKAGLVANRRRAQRGLTAKRADGICAEETCVAALRSLYGAAAAWVPTNAAADIPKPRRGGANRRPLLDFELLELVHLTETTGNDTELDALIVDFGIATGARREGVYSLTVGQLQPQAQIVLLRDKYKTTQPAPISADLMFRLVRHAIRRGGPACNPNNPDFRPDRPVFWQRVGDDYRPLTSRRFDNLALRWQTHLDWANTEQVGFHHLRHTMSAFLGSMYGPQYKKRYLRHADGNVTDMYGACTLNELARALSDLLQFEHPLVHGVDERRREAMGRLGLPPT
jgi:integrase